MENLLRPHQVESLERDISRMEQTLSPAAALFTKDIDRGEMTRQLRSTEKMLETQRPKEIPETELDQAVKREAQLRQEIVEDGMLSHEEMRKNPPGAVSRHMKWEDRNKGKIQEWKTLRLRLNVGDDDGDLANMEQFRPTQSSMNMDGAQITGKSIFLPPDNEAFRKGYDNVWPDEEKLRAQQDALTERAQALNEAGLLPKEMQEMLGLAPITDEPVFDEVEIKAITVKPKDERTPEEAELLKGYRAFRIKKGKADAAALRDRGVD